MIKKSFYITTTIPYVNADPHIGFALELVQSDAIARYQRLMDKDVFMDKERAELRDLIKSLDKTVIANKTLAAGVLNPKDAFDYLKTVDFVDLMTVGIASETEAVETFSLLTK